VEKTDAVNYVKTVLREIQSNIGQTNVEDMLREAQEMLREIKRRNFGQKKDEADDESNKAIEGETKLKFVNDEMRKSETFSPSPSICFQKSAAIFVRHFPSSKV
jgi:spore cortex formation protein SpoVR/YcgB (stage V sporulation)